MELELTPRSRRRQSLSYVPTFKQRILVSLDLDGKVPWTGGDSSILRIDRAEMGHEEKCAIERQRHSCRVL